MSTAVKDFLVTFTANTKAMTDAFARMGRQLRFVNWKLGLHRVRPRTQIVTTQTGETRLVAQRLGGWS